MTLSVQGCLYPVFLLNDITFRFISDLRRTSCQSIMRMMSACGGQRDLPSSWAGEREKGTKGIADALFICLEREKQGEGREISNWTCGFRNINEEFYPRWRDSYTFFIQLSFNVLNSYQLRQNLYLVWSSSSIAHGEIIGYFWGPSKCEILLVFATWGNILYKEP